MLLNRTATENKNNNTPPPFMSLHLHPIPNIKQINEQNKTQNLMLLRVMCVTVDSMWILMISLVRFWNSTVISNYCILSRYVRKLCLNVCIVLLVFMPSGIWFHINGPWVRMWDLTRVVLVNVGYNTLICRVL